MLVEELRVPVVEFFERKASALVVARLAREREVRSGVRSSLRLGREVFDGREHRLRPRASAVYAIRSVQFENLRSRESSVPVFLSHSMRRLEEGASHLAVRGVGYRVERPSWNGVHAAVDGSDYGKRERVDVDVREVISYVVDECGAVGVRVKLLGVRDYAVVHSGGTCEREDYEVESEHYDDGEYGSDESRDGSDDYVFCLSG